MRRAFGPLWTLPHHEEPRARACVFIFNPTPGFRLRFLPGADHSRLPIGCRLGTLGKTPIVVPASSTAAPYTRPNATDRTSVWPFRTRVEGSLNIHDSTYLTLLSNRTDTIPRQLLRGPRIFFLSAFVPSARHFRGGRINAPFRSRSSQRSLLLAPLFTAPSFQG